MLDQGSIAIVTGAGRGIGRQTARLLAEQGARADPASSYVNGSVVVVDGGQTAMLPFPTGEDFT